MNCQSCGQREATVHLLEWGDGERKSVWLCERCAADHGSSSDGIPSDDNLADKEQSSGETASLASFLGQVSAGNKVVDQEPCPVCNYSLAAFRDTNRLGCASCYSHFRECVVPILTRFHRHASHLGKVPARVGGVASRQGEITRIRVALEKAIQNEEYEEAARLRDSMRELTAIEDQRNDGPDFERGSSE